ncbi:MAG: hypothetical protein ACLQVF_39975 [Isosphaeraceae bacterium]
MPADIAVRPYRVDRIVPGVGGDYVVTMGDGRSNFDDSDNPPMPVVVYMGGVTLSAGSSGTGFNPTGNFSNGTAAANTDSADPVGLSKQEQAKLASFINNIGSSDGGSRNGPQDPTATHLALASPARNPADITIPVLVGSEGSGGGGGGDGPDDGGGGGGGSGSHEDFGHWLLGKLGAGAAAVAGFVIVWGDEVQAKVMADGTIGIFYIDKGYYSARAGRRSRVKWPPSSIGSAVARKPGGHGWRS